MNQTMHNLLGKRALVGGASHGIGRACAAALAELGADVTLLARDEKALADVASSLPRSGDQAHGFLAVDFSNPDSLGATLREHIEANGPVHVLINNTGGPASGPLMDATADHLIEGITKHVVAFQASVQAAVPGMKAEKYGRIINIISTSVLLPIQGLGVSNTTRGAVANWGRTLAGELGPFGITVNNILPGFTATDRLTSLLSKKAARLCTTLDAIEQQAKAGIPMGRFADAGEIGAVVAFLASPSASYLSGVNLPVDGARTAVQ